MIMYNTPNEVLKLTEGMALKKYNTPAVKLALLGVLGGAYIALGGWLSFYVSHGMPYITEGNPALVKLIQGVLFPVGLILIILVGGELFTGNTAYLVTGARKRIIPWGYLAKNWGIVWLTNLVGALLLCYLLVQQTGMLASEPWVSAIVSTAKSKVSLPWSTIFFKGIGANWLVCLAVWLGLSSQEMLGRLVGLWLPVMVFVTLGYEHSVANMFYIPMGMMCGADVSIVLLFWNNLIPATFGNIVGGSIFVGLVYSYLYIERK
ncbi:formate/nitrite transporter family protein [Porphyromonas levii]|nr:formate/nitrite transporter family protein [Porphyromonas levii]